MHGGLADYQLNRPHMPTAQIMFSVCQQNNIYQEFVNMTPITNKNSMCGSNKRILSSYIALKCALLIETLTFFELETRQQLRHLLCVRVLHIISRLGVTYEKSNFFFGPLPVTTTVVFYYVKRAHRHVATHHTHSHTLKHTRRLSYIQCLLDTRIKWSAASWHVTTSQRLTVLLCTCPCQRINIFGFDDVVMPNTASFEALTFT